MPPPLSCAQSSEGNYSAWLRCGPRLLLDKTLLLVYFLIFVAHNFCECPLRMSMLSDLHVKDKKKQAFLLQEVPEMYPVIFSKTKNKKGQNSLSLP